MYGGVGAAVSNGGGYPISSIFIVIGKYIGTND
jgi:hypothetical protein